MDVPRENTQHGELADLQATAAGTGAGKEGPQRRMSVAGDGMRDPRSQFPQVYKQGYEGAPPPIGATNGSRNPPAQLPDVYKQGYEGGPPPIGDMSRGAPVQGPVPGPNKLQRNNSMPTSGYRRPSFTAGRLGSLFGRNKRNKEKENENYRDEYFNHHSPTPPPNEKLSNDVRPYATRRPSTDYYDDDDSIMYSDDDEYYSRPLPPAGQPRTASSSNKNASNPTSRDSNPKANPPGPPIRRPSKAERFLGLEAGEEEPRRMSMQGGRSTLEEGQWDGPGYDEREDYFGEDAVPKRKGWKGILGRG
jgi:hypothetical protein